MVIKFGGLGDVVLSLNAMYSIYKHFGKNISLLTEKPVDKLLKNYWEKLSHGSLSLVELIDGSFKILYVGK